MGQQIKLDANVAMWDAGRRRLVGFPPQACGRAELDAVRLTEDLPEASSSSGGAGGDFTLPRPAGSAAISPYRWQPTPAGSWPASPCSDCPADEAPAPVGPCVRVCLLHVFLPAVLAAAATCSNGCVHLHQYGRPSLNPVPLCRLPCKSCRWTWRRRASTPRSARPHRWAPRGMMGPAWVQMQRLATARNGGVGLQECSLLPLQISAMHWWEHLLLLRRSSPAARYPQDTGDLPAASACSRPYDGDSYSFNALFCGLSLRLGDDLFQCDIPALGRMPGAIQRRGTESGSGACTGRLMSTGPSSRECARRFSSRVCGCWARVHTPSSSNPASCPMRVAC